MTNVRLIAISQPMIEGVNTAEELVAYAARVSNPANQEHHASAGKLLKYLSTHAHWSPFEMVSLTMEIKTTRDISRQILRHRSFSFQEFSQRYAVSEHFEVRETRLQDTKNRQNSIDTSDEVLQQAWNIRQQHMIEYATSAYEWAIKNNIAKEQARAVLPEGLTGTTLYMAGTLRSWLHYCSLRMDNGTQKEHRDIAKQCWYIIAEQFPSLVEAIKSAT
jgi:thymidylate synthase (FAD)